MVSICYRFNNRVVRYDDAFSSFALNSLVRNHKTLVSSVFLLPMKGLIRGDETYKSSRFFFYDKSMFKTFLSNFYFFFSGFNNGFYAELITIGVGYRFERLYRDSNVLTMNLGYSHLIYYTIPAHISFRIAKNYLLIFGTDYPELMDLATRIRSYRIPDSYKGKGIRYLGEVIPLKVGKQRQK